MSPEERDELMEFILQSQSDAAARHREFAEEHREMMAHYREMAEQHHEMAKQNREMLVLQGQILRVVSSNTTQIEVLATATHNLVEVARIHSRRLDRLEGLST